MTQALTTAAEAEWITETGLPGVAAPLRAVDDWRCVRRGPAGDTLAVTLRVGVRGDDPNLRGHFPGLAVFPGVFVIEALCQAMALAVAPGPDAPQTAPPVLREVRSVRFLAPLLDGDELTLEITVTPLPDGGWDAKAAATRADGTTSARIRAEFEPGEAADV